MAEDDASGLKWVTLFDNMQAKADAAKKSKSKGKTKNPAAAVADFQDDLMELGEPQETEKGGKSNKRLSVERIYQKKSQLEHILLRPDTYVGSTEAVTQLMWIMDEESESLVQREITYVPGLYKIFDEIIVNAADNKQRDPKMNCIKIDIDPENNKIRVWNNGKGIPVVEHKTEKMYVPTMIFGHLLTSSNYDDSEKKVTGGRNGYGAKLCNIFSNKFVVETSSHEYRKSFKQTWQDNMSKTKEPTISESKEYDFTSVTFYPDLSKFKMSSLDKDTVALFTRRAYDIAASTKGVRVFLNGKKVPVKNFREYVDLHLKDKYDEAGAPLKVVYENPNERWEVAVTLSDKGFQQSSFVNSIATTKGGRHVDYITDQVVSKLIDIVKRKNKGGVNIKPFQVKSHMWVFVNCLIENPSFDSQTKENMTLQTKSFGSKCQLGEKFIAQASKCGIIESILSWMKFKAQAQLNKKCHASKHSKLKGIPKLDDANDAGTKNSIHCTLILTEGDSAKSLAVAGLGVIGRDRYGVFPLKGKVLNVREATHKQIMDNAEINNIIKIMGLQFKEKYDSPEKLRTLRYGKIMIMTDQDQDGSHIKGLLINFVHHFWPNLLKYNVIEEFITPIVKVMKSKNEKSFYSLPEFEEWKRDTENWHTWKIKYYKGLGTSTAKEAKEYFSDMDRHLIFFKYSGKDDDASINLAFSKKKTEERKEWLTNWMEDRKRRIEMGLPELYLYGKDTKRVSYDEFINRELILFSNMDNVRSIPSLVDGLKPGQRKVMFTCFKRNLTKEVKVAQFAGSVAEHSAYHHGEGSLMSTIINLAQNFVGSNNINLLQPLGQFGTRLHGGKDAASPRYIFTMLSPLTRLIFHQFDDPLLNNLYDDNQKIEPEYYCPVIPMVLVNGTDGIGTGWSTKIPNYDPREIIANLKRMVDGLDPHPLVPSYKNFRGTVEEIGDSKYIVSGEVSIIDDQTIEITELPIRTWTQNYKEEILEPMLHGTEKTPSMITDYKEYHTDSTVKFIIKMAPEKLAQAEETGLHKVFKLQSALSTGTMVLFDHNGCIRRYSNVEQILREFFELRLEFYNKRKEYLEGMLSAESLRLDNIARFIMEKIEGTVVIENKPKKEIIQMLVRRGYDSDPVKSWKEAQNKAKEAASDEENDDESDVGNTSGPDFNYILSLALWCLTKEKKDELLKQRDAKAEELSVLRGKSPKDLWKEDLECILQMLDKVEQQERDDEKATLNKVSKSGKTGGKIRPKKICMEETKPSPMGRRVVPRIDVALKIKAEKDALKKLKLKEKKILRLEDDGDVDMDMGMGEEDSEPKSLAERLNFGNNMKAKTAAPRVRKPKSSPAKSRDSGDSSSPVKGKKRKGKKKNPWSDSEDEDEDSDLDLDMDDSEQGGSFIAIPRERGPRRAAAEKVKYSFGDDENDEMMNGSDNSVSAPVSDDNSSVPAKETKSSSANPPHPKVTFKPLKPPSPIVSANFSDSDDDDGFSAPSTIGSQPSSQITNSQKTASDSTDENDIFRSKASKPVKKPPPKKAPSKGTDSESDHLGSLNSDDDDTFPSKPAEPAKKPPAKPAVTKAHQMGSDSESDKMILDSDEDDIFPPKPVKKPAAKPAVKRAPKKVDLKQPSVATMFAKTSTAKPKSKPKARKISLSDDDIISINSDKDPGEKKPKKPRKKKAADSDMSDDDKPKKKKKAPVKRVKDSDSDDSEIDYIPKKKRTTAKKKSGDSSDEEFAVESIKPTERVPRGGSRTVKTVKYFESDDEDFDDY